SGAVLAFESRRPLRRADGSTYDAHLWVRSLRMLGLHAALVVFARFGGSDPLDPGAGIPAVRLDLGGAVAVGSIDLELRILSCSADIVEVLDEGPEVVIGDTLTGRVHPDDVATLLLGIGRAVADEHGAAMHVRIRNAADDYVGVRLVVNPIRGTTLARLGFVMTAESVDQPADARVADLERHLWRIALEVEAAGVSHGVQRIPDAGRVAGLDAFSPRQWEIVTRLLRGERVPEIARALFLSQSTVRNQLGAVYRKLDVHSQSELLAPLRGRTPDPDPD
ncbi:MAG: LuxR C-terminal-related transcriptional regulator, partial [Actinomycetota bacterium]